jgi:hypothetical protein
VLARCAGRCGSDAAAAAAIDSDTEAVFAVLCRESGMAANHIGKILSLIS